MNDTQIISTKDLEGIKKIESWKSFQVDSDEAQTEASTRLRLIADKQKELKKQQDFLVKPLKDQAKKIEAVFKQVTVPLKQVDLHLRSSLGQYMNKKRIEKERIAREEREAEAKRIREEAEKRAQLAADVDDEKEFERAVVLETKAEKVEAKEVKVRETVKTDSGNVGSMVQWKWRVKDPNKIPREYMNLNTIAIAKALRTCKDKENLKIDGIEFYQVTVPVVR